MKGNQDNISYKKELKAMKCSHFHPFINSFRKEIDIQQQNQ